MYACIFSDHHPVLVKADLNILAEFGQEHSNYLKRHLNWDKLPLNDIRLDASVNRCLKQALARKTMIETSLRQHKRDLKRKRAQKEAYILTLLKENARLKEEPSVQDMRKLRRSKAKMKCDHNKCRQNEVIQRRLQRENRDLHARSLELEVGNEILIEDHTSVSESGSC